MFRKYLVPVLLVVQVLVFRHVSQCVCPSTLCQCSE